LIEETARDDRQAAALAQWLDVRDEDAVIRVVDDSTPNGTLRSARQQRGDAPRRRSAGRPSAGDSPSINLNGPFYAIYHLHARIAAAGGRRVVSRRAPHQFRRQHTVTRRRSALTSAWLSICATRGRGELPAPQLMVWTEASPPRSSTRAATASDP
jgi:hypothetical protein